MAETVLAIAATAANWATNVAVSLGANQAVATAVWYAAYTATVVGLSVAPGLVAQALASLPTPAQARIPIRQAVPPRQSAFGRVRASGPYMLFEEYQGDSYDVIAFHDGEIDGIETRYLHEDVVTIGTVSINDTSHSDGVEFSSPTRQYTVALRWNDNTGEASETAHAAITDCPEWGSDHRGDGIASIGLRCYGVKAEKHNEVYPYGLPQPSVVFRAQLCYDEREAGHDPDDVSTWEWSDNSIVCLTTYLIETKCGGMGFDYARRIAPSAAAWEAAADVCDESVTLKAGGTEARYRCGGVYRHDSDPADVIRALLATCDGWMTEAGDGSLTVVAGKYSAPNVTLTDDHILGYAGTRYRPDEQAINEFIGRYVSPAHKYEELTTDPWRDEDAITAQGATRTQEVPLQWVQSHGQARRLLKRLAHRADAWSGTLVTNLYGLQCFNERYVAVQLSEVPSLNDAVVEILGFRMNLSAMTCELSVVVIDSSIDDWTASSEEGTAPGVGASVTVSVPSTPTIDSVDVLTSGGLRMQVNITKSSFYYATYMVRYRRSNGDSPETYTEWKYESFIEPDLSGSTVPCITAVVPEGTYQVQASVIGATGAPTDWSSSTEVTVTAAVTPDPPSGVEGGTA